MNTTKRNAAIAIDIQMPAGILTLTFANGKALTIGKNDLTEEQQTRALLRGVKEKLVDAAAISRNPETGRPATIDDKYNAVKAVYDRLLAGQWNAAREGGGGGSGGLLFKALCRMYSNKSPEQIAAFLAGKTDAEKTALRKNPKIAAIIEELRAETGKAANIDTDELLGELED